MALITVANEQHTTKYSVQLTDKKMVMRLQKIKNEIQDTQNAINQAHYKAETWVRLLAETGNNLTNDEFSRLLDAMQHIINSLEPYRN